MTLPNITRSLLGTGALFFALLGSTAPAFACVGDCNEDNEVTVDEIVSMLRIALGDVDRSACTAGDSNEDGGITVEEVITAVNNALTGCPADQPTTLTGNWQFTTVSQPNTCGDDDICNMADAAPLVQDEQGGVLVGADWELDRDLDCDGSVEISTNERQELPLGRVEGNVLLIDFCVPEDGGWTRTAGQLSILDDGNLLTGEVPWEFSDSSGICNGSVEADCNGSDVWTLQR